MRQRAWTADETQRLRELKQAGMTASLIGHNLGRTKFQVDSKWQRMKQPPDPLGRWRTCPPEFRKAYEKLRRKAGAPVARKQIEKEVEVSKTKTFKEAFPIKSNWTHVGVLIDESGSMMMDRDKTINSFNEYVQNLQSQNLAYRVSLATFSAITGVRSVFTDVPVGAVPTLTRDSYTPQGGTPLYDAVATMIRQLETRADRGSVMTIIMTDGQENSSIEFPMYQPEKIRALITRKQVVDGWAFVFIGADLTKDAVRQYSSVMGMQAANTVSYGKADVSPMMKHVAAASANYAQGTVVSSNVFNNLTGDTTTLDEIEKTSKTPR